MRIYTLEPAFSVISEFTRRGECGVNRVAAIIGISAHAVRLWTYPKDKRGSGGRIPRKHHQKLLEAAQHEGLKRVCVLLNGKGALHRGKKAD